MLIIIWIHRATGLNKQRQTEDKIAFKWYWRIWSSFIYVAICSHEQDMTCLCAGVTRTVLHLIANNMIKEHVVEGI